MIPPITGGCRGEEARKRWSAILATVWKHAVKFSTIWKQVEEYLTVLNQLEKYFTVGKHEAKYIFLYTKQIADHLTVQNQVAKKKNVYINIYFKNLIVKLNFVWKQEVEYFC